MAHSFRIYDETESVQLNSGSIQSTRYAPQSSAPQQGNVGTSGDYGLMPWERGDVTESFELFIQDSSIANLQATRATLMRLEEKVRLRQKDGTIPPVYLGVQFDGEAEEWRSEILVMRLLFANAAEQVSRLRMEAMLSITRRYFFETVAEKQLLISSAETTTPATTAILYNTDQANATQQNWFQIAAAQIVGGLPAPLRYRLTNADSVAQSWADFYISNYVFVDPPTINPQFLGSSASGGASVAWGSNSEIVAWRWGIGTAQLAALAGREYRILIALNSGSTNTTFRPEIQATSLQFALTNAKQFRAVAGDLYDIGSIPIPPGGYNRQATSLDLVVRAQRTSGGSLDIDFVQITPAGPGLFRHLKQQGFQTPVGGAIEDNGPEGTAYYWDGSYRWPIVTAYNHPIWVWPNRINRIRVLYRESDFTAGRKLSVQAWYRPRRGDI